MRSIATILLTFALAAGCGKKEEEAAPAPTPTTTTTTTTTTTPATVDPKAKAKEIFTQRCVSCHGEKGAGDGPASAGLDPKPRNFTDPEWQKSVDDAYLEKIIKMGGTAVGKSAAMPPNPDITDPAVITALKDIVRSLGAT